MESTVFYSISWKIIVLKSQCLEIGRCETIVYKFASFGFYWTNILKMLVDGFIPCLLHVIYTPTLPTTDDKVLVLEAVKIRP